MTSRFVAAAILLLATTAASAQWKYTSDEDKMRGERTKYAETRSTNRIQLGFPYRGGSALQIFVRESPRDGRNVFLVLERGQLPCHSDCSIFAKFDDDDVIEYGATGASNGRSEALFIDEHELFLEELKKAKKVILEVLIYDHGSSQFSFNVKGLKWPEPAPKE